MYSSLYSSRFGRSPRPPPPSSVQVRRVANAVIMCLSKAGISHACFVGGMACKLFGNLREPNDVDVLCLTDEWEQEALKRKLVELDPNFYLVNARNPRATYKVLWYRLADTLSRVKVDLLFPGVLDIPSIPASSITSENPHRLPCAPLTLVLLLKLQAWVHHGDASEYRYRETQPMDAADVHALLHIACARKLKPLTDKSLPPLFVEKSVLRVKRFVVQEPSSRVFWEQLGLLEKERMSYGVIRQGHSSLNILGRHIIEPRKRI